MATQEKILITGASGYIGSILVRRLSEYAKVYALVRTPSSVTFGKSVTVLPLPNAISELSKSLPEEITYVFHLAAPQVQLEPSSAYAEETMSCCLTLPSVIVENLRSRGLRGFINVGTYWQHFSEERPIGNSLYAAAKNSFESILDFYAEFHEIGAITLRLPDVLGPSDNRPKLHTRIMSAPARSRIDLTGGEQIIQPLSIQDVIDALLKAKSLVADPAQSSHLVYSIYGERVTLKHFVRMICERHQLDLDLNWGSNAYYKRANF